MKINPRDKTVGDIWQNLAKWEKKNILWWLKNKGNDTKYQNLSMAELPFIPLKEIIDAGIPVVSKSIPR